MLQWIRKWLTGDAPEAKEQTPPAPPNQMMVKELNEYKGRLYSSLSRDLSEFEKNFLFIAAGTLAFSITFIKDIVKIDTALLLPLLFTGWAFIAVAIGIMMFTFIISASSSDKIWFKINEFQQKNKKYNDTDILSATDVITLKELTNTIFEKSKRVLRTLRYVAIGSFLVGLLCFGYFTGSNLYTENKKHRTKEDIVTINFNSKTQQLQVAGIKLVIKDSALFIEK